MKTRSSGAVTIVEDHKLIRSGPCPSIRHPIYTDMIVALAGTVLVMGEYRTLLGFVILACGFIFKAKREERILAQQFGEVFEEHRWARASYFREVVSPKDAVGAMSVLNFRGNGYNGRSSFEETA